MKNVVIVGGGIAGLATAFYLRKFAPDTVNITLIESASRLGGKITSLREDGFLVEGGPDSFITQKTAALTLCRELGLESDLIGSNQAQKASFVYHRGGLHPMPEGMMMMAPTMMLPFLRSGLISWPGKARMGMEIFLPPRKGVSEGVSDESLASFVRRRLGAEALEKIAAPLMAGIYSADPEELSLQSTFPMFLEMERKHGGLLRGVLLKKRTRAAAPVQSGSKPLSMFVTLRGGLQQLVDAIAARLDARTILLHRQIVAVNRDPSSCNAGYQIAFSDGSLLQADEVVFATPAYVTGELIRPMDAALASRLEAIRYVSTATVSLGYKHSDIKHSLNGSGFVVPHGENRRITACSWSSTKFSHRAPRDSVLIRAFAGGARAETLAEQTEAALIDMVREELAITMGIAATPVLTKAYRWSRASPQYIVGHQDRLDEIERMVSTHPGLYLAGAAYRGPGIPDCILGALKVAQQIAEKYSGLARGKEVA